MIPKAKKVKFDRPPVEKEGAEVYKGGFDKHVEDVDELAMKLVGACEPYNTAVILDSLETVMRGAVTLMGEEEGEMFEEYLLAFHKRLAAMTILRSLLGGRLDVMSMLKRTGGEKQSLDDLVKDMERAAGPDASMKDPTE
jgi:hypothetical protein